MADIQEFARRAAREFRDSKRGMPRRFKLTLPLGIVEEFIKNVFYASLIPDEGRYPTATFMTYRGGDREFHVCFRQPLPPTAPDLAKLAHAVAPGSHIGCIAHEGKVLVGGFQVTMLDEMRHFGYASSRAANPLKLTIKGPGHIEFSAGGTALIYKAGQIEEEELLQHSDVLRALGGQLEQEFTGHTRGVVESLEDIFNDLVEGIVKLAHGGMLIVVKKVDVRKFSSCRRVCGGLLRQLLVRYWDDTAALNQAAGGVANLLNHRNPRVTSPHSLTVATDVTMLENCIRSIAHLAGMDGAVVMDYACNVVAFNAIISKAVGRSRPARLEDRFGRELPEAEVTRNRGSRHQSAMSYARRVPNSFVFVVSQDGGVSVFHNRGNGTVLCERGLRVLE